MDHAPYEFDDSDEETDNLTKTVDKHETGSKTPGASFKTIEITQHCYETYLALLCWIGTGRIAFAPLRSTFVNESTGEGEESHTRAKLIEDSLELADPRSPSLVSPKSIYRLADYLQISKLSQIALANFTSQLTHDNVLQELYSDLAGKYPAIRDITLDYTVEHWKEIVKTRGYEEVSKKGDDGGLDGATGLLLSAKLMERWAK